MAAPQFFTPQRPSRSRPARRFSLSQANATLPLVQRIVADIVKAHAIANSHRERVESISGGKELTAAQAELGKAVEHLKELVEELSEVGAELKDFETGLIDFLGRHEGRDIYLCWKLGEEKITHWHELNAGFAGRKPVAMLKESA